MLEPPGDEGHFVLGGHFVPQIRLQCTYWYVHSYVPIRNLFPLFAYLYVPCVYMHHTMFSETSRDVSKGSLKRLETFQKRLKAICMKRLWDVSETSQGRMYAWDVSEQRRLRDVSRPNVCMKRLEMSHAYIFLGSKCFRIFFTMNLAVKIFRIFFTMNLAVKIFSNFFTMNLAVKIYRIFFTMNLAVKIFRIFLYSRINFFFLSSKMKSHLSQTPYLVSMLFSRPGWSFFQDVLNIWGIPFKTFLGLLGELKTFWGNLGLHVSLITLWRHVKIMLCTNIYEKFDRKKNSNFFLHWIWL